MAGLKDSVHLRRWAFPVYLACTVALGVELGARVLFPEYGDAQLLRRRAWARLLNSAVRSPPPGDAAFGLRLSPSTRRTQRRGDLAYTVVTNTLGFRGREPTPRRTDEVRLLLLGDSMVFGDGLEEDETIAAGIEAAGASMRRPVTAYNGAVSGMNTVQELLVARWLLPELAPDHVLLGYFVGNDPLPNTISRLDGGGRFAVDQDASRDLRSALDAHLNPRLASHAFRAVALPFWIPRLRYQWSARPDVVRRSCDLVAQVAELCANADVRFTVLILYPRDGVAGGLADLWSGSRTVGRRVGACLRDRDIEIIDTTDFLDGRAARDEYFFARDGHLNAAGAARVAEELVRRLLVPLDSG